MHFLKSLDRPPRDCTPIPFWFLNGDLTHREIRRQLQDFHDHHVYGVVLHPRIGLSRRIGYLSPLFFRYLRTAIRTAAELEMKIVLYDEGMYPSGSAGGLVVKDHPELASRGLALTDLPAPEDHVLWKTEKGFLVERFSHGTIRGLHFGEDDGEPGAPPSADILNPVAVDRFLDLTHEAYAREFSEDFGSTILGFFTDEPSILGRNAGALQPWTKDFHRVFLAEGGNPEGLTGLFSGEENADTRLYRRLILRQEETVYYARLSAWCEAHGLALMGHPHQSDDIEVEKYFHIPGQDLVLRWVAPEKGGTAGMDTTMAKCSADMARLMNRKRNSNECFGASNRDQNPWYFTGADMKWYIDWLAVRGVNMFIPHAFYYSLRGKRSGERPPDVGPGNIWWPHYRMWSDYMARLSLLMSEARMQPRIAVPCRNRDLRPEAVEPLFRSQRGFLYLPESFWPECRERNGKLLCRGFSFDAVLGPGDLFPSVSHDPFSVPADCLCGSSQPQLRSARLFWQDREMWFLVNEGPEPLQTVLTLPCAGLPGAYDLWEGKAWRVETQATEAGRQFPLHLEPRESILLFSCPTPEAWSALPARPRTGQMLTDSDFVLQETQPGSFRKIYTAKLLPDSLDAEIRVHAPEMVELYSGNRLLGAAFWAPQVIRVPAEIVRKGASLRLVVTGSKANEYGTAPVPFGLEDFRRQSPEDCVAVLRK